MGRKEIGTLTSYEILLMLDPEQAEAREDEIVARAREQVEKSGGTWQSHDAWGRRRLAYPIAKKEDGVYHLLVFDADGPTLDEVSRILRIDDAVLRHMATRHIAGSRTSAPRDDASAPVAAAAPETAPSEAPAVEAPAVEAPAVEAPAVEAPAVEAPAVEAESEVSETDVSAEAEPEYAPTEEEPVEVPAEEEEES
jgi:small subunit ribosomal protein S6